jgi:hypothetical protein
MVSSLVTTERRLKVGQLENLILPENIEQETDGRVPRSIVSDARNLDASAKTCVRGT